MVNDSALFAPIPASTVRAARALYGRGNLYLRLGDRLNHLASKFDQGIMSAYADEDQAALYGLLTIIQYVEKLTDDELAKSIQLRMDLRYALHLTTPSPKLDPHSFCEFRNQILNDQQRRRFFEEIFKHIYPEITSTVMNDVPAIDDVLNSICENQIRASLIEAMLCSMEALSANYFNWLRRVALPHWYQRYNRSLIVITSENPTRKQDPTREDIQKDIQHLLCEIRASNSREIMEMQETKNLNFILEQLSDSNSMKNCNHCINQIH
jgi:hypothetical protein